MFRRAAVLITVARLFRRFTAKVPEKIEINSAISQIRYVKSTFQEKTNLL
jgi:hypothetical protein